MNIPGDVREILGLLSQGTRSNQLTWHSTSEPNVYRLLTAGGYIHLLKSEDDPPQYGIGAFDADGGVMLEAQLTREEFPQLADLYEEVAAGFRRQGIDKLMQYLRDVVSGKLNGMKAAGGFGAGGNSLQGMSLLVGGKEGSE